MCCGICIQIPAFSSESGMKSDMYVVWYLYMYVEKVHYECMFNSYIHSHLALQTPR